MRRRHAVHEEEHENHERWLLTYADLITLLLALFMMLYAMSVLDLKKYQQFQEAFSQGMGGHKVEKATEIAPDSSAAVVPASATSPSKTLDQSDLIALKKQLEASLKKAGLQDEVQVQLQSRGLVLNVVSGVLFDSGSATLTRRGIALLKSLEPVFAGFANNLVVEGHTDPRPIRGSFPSNWELSTARATAVVRDFLELGIRDKRLSAAGYADTRPRASNATEEGMARNRRVDIVVLAVNRKPVAPASPAPTASEAPKEESSSH